jgi:tRNA1(Val) A37 N6-methylase TrmN6
MENCSNSGIIDLGLTNECNNVEIECYGATQTTAEKVDYNAQYITELKNEISNLEAQLKCVESDRDNAKDSTMKLTCASYSALEMNDISAIKDTLRQGIHEAVQCYKI